jgi:hypothetical protein
MAYYTNLTPYVPTTPGLYPGQGEPSLVIGQAIHTNEPVGAEIGQAQHTAVAPLDPAIGKLNKHIATLTTAETATAIFLNPVLSPVIGHPAHTPLLTPLGTSPHYKTPTQIWSWDYGNGGGGSGNGGSWS